VVSPPKFGVSLSFIIGRVLIQVLLPSSLQLIEIWAGFNPIQYLRLIIRRQMGESITGQKCILMSKPKLVESRPAGEARRDKVWGCLWKDAEQMQRDAVEDTPRTAFQFLNQCWD